MTIKSGLSTATPVNHSLPTLTVADLVFASQSAPAMAAISGAANPGVTQLRMPGDTPACWTEILISNWGRKDWLEIGTLSAYSQILLPIPQQLIDAQSIDFETVELGFLGAGALNVLSGFNEMSAQRRALALAEAGSLAIPGA